MTTPKPKREELLRLCDRLMVEVYDPSDAEWQVARALQEMLQPSPSQADRGHMRAPNSQATPGSTP